MPRDKSPRMVVAGPGFRDFAVVMRRAAVGEAFRPCWHRSPRGIEGTLPGRVSCVRNVTIPSRSRLCVAEPGKPTVRKAQFLGGQWMAKKRTPAAERQQET